MTVLSKYEQDLKQNEWQSDPAQLAAITRLDYLLQAINKPRPSKWLSWFKADLETPQGIYMWGGVGRGKTYLMDLLFEQLDDETPALRQHFHRFMADVHDQLKAVADRSDPLTQVAMKISKRAKIICFDEFFVSDIADAMILGRLFKHLFERDIVLIATSNVAPEDLYKDGLQRSQFLPAIDALVKHCEVIEVDGGEDYRLRVLRSANIYCWPHQHDTDQYLEDCFSKIAPDIGTEGALMIVERRQIQTVRRADGIVWFTFGAICDGPRGAADYIEIARTFQTVIISDIPLLNNNLENQARRFITMVDEFYDRRVKLIVSAAAPIERLYEGSKLSFEFQRTSSRLIEMQGEDYLKQVHIA